MCVQSVRGDVSVVSVLLQDGNWRAVKVLFSFHGVDVLPHRFVTLATSEARVADVYNFSGWPLFPTSQRHSHRQCMVVFFQSRGESVEMNWHLYAKYFLRV